MKTNFIKNIAILLVFISLNLLIGCKEKDLSKEKESSTNRAEIENAQDSESNDTSYPTDVFWGDTHLHTDLSMDAGAFGNRIGMDEAYKFARGEEITQPQVLKLNYQGL